MRRFTHHPKVAFSHDLHVLSTPPAFVLSQDQTLQFELGRSRSREANCSVVRMQPPVYAARARATPEVANCTIRTRHRLCGSRGSARPHAIRFSKTKRSPKSLFGAPREQRPFGIGRARNPPAQAEGRIYEAISGASRASLLGKPDRTASSPLSIPASEAPRGHSDVFPPAAESFPPAVGSSDPSRFPHPSTPPSG